MFLLNRKVSSCFLVKPKLPVPQDHEKDSVQVAKIVPKFTKAKVVHCKHGMKRERERSFMVILILRH